MFKSFNLFFLLVVLCLYFGSGIRSLTSANITITAGTVPDHPIENEEFDLVVEVRNDADKVVENVTAFLSSHMFSSPKKLTCRSANPVMLGSILPKGTKNASFTLIGEAGDYVVYINVTSNIGNFSWNQLIEVYLPMWKYVLFYVALPIFGVAILVISGVFLYKRYKKKRSATPSMRKISRFMYL